MVLQGQSGVDGHPHDWLEGPTDGVLLSEVDREYGGLPSASVEERDRDVEMCLVQPSHFKQCHIGSWKGRDKYNLSHNHNVLERERELCVKCTSRRSGKG